MSQNTKDTKDSKETSKKTASQSGGGKNTSKGSANGAKGGTRRGEQAKLSDGKGKRTVVTEIPRSERVIHQVIPYLLIVLAVFLVACYLFHDSAGKVGVLGRGIDWFLTGLLGWPAFLIPLVLINLAVFWRKYVDLHLTGVKITLSSLSILFTSALVQVFRVNRIGAATYKFKELWDVGNALSGGGVLGGYVGTLSWQCIGFVGSLIVLIPVILVLLMFLVGVTPRYLFTRCRYLWKMRSEQRAQEREERRAAEAERLAREEQEYYEAKMRAQNEAARAEEAEKARMAARAEFAAQGVNFDEPTPAAEPKGKKKKRKNDFIEMDEMRSAETVEDNGALNFGKDDNLDDFLPAPDAGRGKRNAAGYSQPELIIPAEPTPAPEEPIPLAAPGKRDGRRAPENPLVDETPAPADKAAPAGEDISLSAVPLPSDAGKDHAATATPAKDTPNATLSVEVDEAGKQDQVDLQSLVNTRRRRPTNPLVEDLAHESDYHDVDDILAGIVPDAKAGEGKKSDGAEKSAVGDELLALPELKPIAEDENENNEVNSKETEDLLAALTASVATAGGASAKSAAGATATGAATAATASTPAAISATKPTAGAPVASAAKGGVVTDASGEAVEEEEPEREYVFPPITCLAENKTPKDEDVTEELRDNAKRLMNTLSEFNVRIKEITYSRGPTITRYELKPDAGIRVRSIANLVDDIALSLATSGVRIEAPIPNKPAVGIEVPNRNRATVYLRDLIDCDRFREEKSNLTACLGMDVAGKAVYFDIAKMPHLLIAGATGMGKSVCINSIIVSMLYKAKPEDVRLILIDPKKVEFNIYRDIPLLAVPIVVDAKRAAGTLSAAVAEMERRFELIEMTGVRDIKAYNEITRGDPEKEHLPQMVIIIDELAELMMVAKDQVETSICRIAQKARAAGMHLIIGTQRPSVDVITGVLKANIPSRIACTVASQVDSRTIIDVAGAEKLIGRGDMLFAPVGSAKPQRVQGAFVSESEVEDIVSFVRKNNSKVRYNRAFIDRMEEEVARAEAGNRKGGEDDDEDDGGEGGDSKFKQALRIAVETGKISTSLLQRKLEIGYGRAAKIIDQMEELGYVSAPDGNKPRKILITKEEFMEKSVNGDL